MLLQVLIPNSRLGIISDHVFLEIAYEYPLVEGHIVNLFEKEIRYCGGFATDSEGHPSQFFFPSKTALNLIQT